MVQWHPIWQQKLCGGILVSPVLQSSSTGIHHGHTSTHHYRWSRLVTGHGNQQHRLREGVNKKNCDIKLLHPCQVTCNNKVTTNADTRQAPSGWGEVSSQDPCRGASGPGLGGGEGVRAIIIITVSSTHNIHLHSVYWGLMWRIVCAA